MGCLGQVKIMAPRFFKRVGLGFSKELSTKYRSFDLIQLLHIRLHLWLELHCQCKICHAGVLVMRKYTEKRNTDGYTVILSIFYPSNIYGVFIVTVCEGVWLSFCLIHRIKE